MKTLMLLLAIGAGTYMYNEMQDPSSDLGQTAQQIMSDLQSGFDAGSGTFSGDYASTAAGRPNTMDWAARGGSSVGGAPDPQPMFGRTNDPATARQAANDSYSRFVSQSNKYGPNSVAARHAYQEYLNAKYHYDALANRAGRNGGW